MFGILRLLNPWVWLGLLITALLLFSAGTLVGATYENRRLAKKQLKAVVTVVKEADKQVERDVVQAEKEIVYIDRVKTIVGPIRERIVYETKTNTVYADCKLTDNGMRDLNSLISETNAAIKGTGTVPAPGNAGK